MRLKGWWQPEAAGQAKKGQQKPPSGVWRKRVPTAAVDNLIVRNLNKQRTRKREVEAALTKAK